MQAETSSSRPRDIANGEQNALRLPSAERSRAVSLDVSSHLGSALTSVGSLERARCNKSAQRPNKRFVFLFACIGNLGGSAGVDGCKLAPKKDVPETRSRSFDDGPQSLGRAGSSGNPPANPETISCLLRVNSFSSPKNSPSRVMECARILQKQHASGYGS